MIEKPLTNNITSYDLLKTFAVIIMIIDHIGHYGLVDSEWMRAIGRMSFPIWLFLVGYSNKRTIPKDLVFGALILSFAGLLVGKPIFHLNILYTIIFVRLSIDYILSITKKSKVQFYVVIIYIAFLIVPSGWLFEYGTMAFISAMYGYYVKHNYKNKAFVLGFMIFTNICFIYYTQLTFGFNLYAAIFMAIGVMAINMFLFNFQPKEYNYITKLLPTPVKAIIQYCGRNTLQIYVIHLMVFKLMNLVYIKYIDWTPLGFQLF